MDGSLGAFETPAETVNDLKLGISQMFDDLDTRSYIS